QYDHFKKNMFQIMNKFDEDFDGNSLNLLPLKQDLPCQLSSPYHGSPNLMSNESLTDISVSARSAKPTMMIRKTIVTDPKEVSSSSSISSLSIPLSILLPSSPSLSHAPHPGSATPHHDSLFDQSLGMAMQAGFETPAPPTHKRKKRTVEDIMAELMGETNEKPVPAHPVGSDTPRLDSMSADQFLDRILGSDWKNQPPYETPQQFKDKRKKRSMEEVIGELAAQANEEEMEQNGNTNCSENTEGLHRCPFEGCDCIFNKIGTLADHSMRDHYWIGAMMLQCTKCQELFACERSFNTHLLSCSLGEINFIVKKWSPEESKAEAEARSLREQKLQKCPFKNCYYSGNQITEGIYKHIATFHHTEGRVAYQCGCGTTRRKLKTILFHLYKECRGNDVNWFIAGSKRRKKNHQEDDEDDE
ncbi:hypothetical protein PFISCL1PPCAC_25315, partial [Pristionchus fissidentatus]